jgi:hypothetical protein
MFIMKNTARIFGLVALVAMSLNGCKKANQDPILNGPNQNYESYKKGGNGPGSTVTDTIFVSVISVQSAFKIMGNPGPTGFPKWRYSGEAAFVTVVNNQGNPVSGVSVSGTWSGCFSGSKSATTDAYGVAEIVGVSTAPSSCTATFTVTGISKSGTYYNATANVVSSGSKVYQ